ncbi:hypothetical protein P167DRAFT_545506 [Morchella conica CCBAS932]|uniref:Heterokaryon incompatibility domain-containing protein n=1 Tax=Morchella conica CCBAS932 TaxID=1392247 RepID=A0A3N4KPU7_9PEZI|nr:hypothetical protein P167DRAFT_545506 [Morchella conica CCBAS932]
MEHLFYHDKADRKGFGSVEPTTEWLRFHHHESVPLTNFHDYPSARGWDMDRVWRGDLGAAHPSLNGLSSSEISSSVAALLQSWLYLGLLEAALQKRVPVKSFTIENTGSIPKLFSMRLGTYFNAWDTQARIMLKDPSKQKQWNRSVVDALVEAHSWVARLSRFQRQTEDCRVTGGLQARFPEFGDQVCGTLPAIIRLAEAIDCGRRRIFRSCHADVSPALTWKCPDGAAGARRHRLQSRHWCPFTISMLEATTCQSVMDWIDSTQKEYPSPHHASCTESACSRNNLNTSAYKTEHVNPQCVCAFIAPSLDDMIPIFQQDGTPVIRVVHNGVETRLEVSASSPRNPYVAFSHVWVDGLGSVSEKGIPTCQALRLSALAEEALGPGAALWIDSLCIPETYVWRKRATTALNRTYREATAVVVVDQTIRKSQRGIDAEDFLLAIYTSAWCQRLWTYLESILAQSIFFEVSEGLMRFPISSSKFPKTVRVIWEALAKEIFRLRNPDGLKLNLGHIARALAWRSTTKCDAETIALGTVLGIDVRRLLKVNAEVRKMMFFKLVKRLPYNIIFLSGPKLSLRPFRWAPFTLMSQVGIRLDADDGSQTSLCTANGLVGNYLVLRLSRSMTKCPVTRKWYAFDSSSDATYILTAPSYGWSSEPDSCPFDHIAIDSEFKEVPSFNRVTSAVALMGKRKCSIPDVTVCNYVGPMFLECVRGNIRSIEAVLCNTQALDLCIQ